MKRVDDWLSQGDSDLQAARHSLSSGDFEWACFQAQQSAEKVLKATLQHLGVVEWDHSIVALVARVEKEVGSALGLIAEAIRLDKLYIPTRYPNSFASGAPKDYYTREDAGEAIRDAEKVREAVKRIVGK